jgi:hypothetical protein
MNDGIRQEKERSLWDKQAHGYDKWNLKMYEKAYGLAVEKACAVLSPRQCELF